MPLIRSIVFVLLVSVHFVFAQKHIRIENPVQEMLSKNPHPRLTPAGVILSKDFDLSESFILDNLTDDEVWVQLKVSSADEKVVISIIENGVERREEIFSNKIESLGPFYKGIIEIPAIRAAHITSVWHIEKRTADFGTAGSCNVNVRCPEGNNYQLQRRSVVRMNVPIGGFIYYCTGALVNNTAQDRKPYLLSAEHCVLDDNDVIIDSVALASIVFRFNWEAPTCTNPPNSSGIPNQIITGGRLRARSNDGGGATGSDMLLLELAIQPPNSYNVFYAGWNRNNIPAIGGAGIHHPNGDIKKISTYTATLQSGTFQQAQGAFWLVNWVATQSGHGVTEGGSSGSPLFNSAGEIIGTLTGGSASCSFRTGTDFYGKFWYHWDKNGTANNRQLRPWLDPLNTGQTSLGGLYVNQQEFEQTVHSWRLYPNPSADGRFTLSYSGTHPTREAEITLTDMTGRVLHRLLLTDISEGMNQHFQLNRAGVYILHIESENKTWHEKVVVAQ
ncbi:MAG: T9SS type A sorting domain-containing protein [Thermaurantimonas sp.]|uniref:T9SS type A sorting domain-containing protein n=1 Tax=Thermaurantimonas sp. TaxID=2681568 RepID=UPI00391DBDDB